MVLSVLERRPNRMGRRTSSVQRYFSLAIMAFDNMGSTGNSAIRRPSFVNSPLSFNAANAYNNSNALIRVSAGGLSIKSKSIRLLIPRDFNRRTTMPRFVRWISGMVLSSSSFAKAHLVYSRNAFPGPTRPARPAL